MAINPCVAIGRVSTSGKQILVRVTPGADQAYLGAIPLEMGGYEVADARTGADGLAWVRLNFVGGLSGWVRADEIDIAGDCTPVGYGVISPPMRAAMITRGAVGQVITPPQPIIDPPQPIIDPPQPILPPQPIIDPPQPPAPIPQPVPLPPAPAPVPVPPVPPPTTGDNSPDRVRKAAFNITAGFEGGGYATYQNRDSGIVSFGRFQFTLQSGSLFSVLDRYLQRASGAVADELRGYAGRTQAREEGLRGDTRYRDLLIAAANDPIMQTVQDEIATEVYWNRVQELSIRPRAIVSPLGQALLFDMAINHGVFHDMIGKAEQELGVQPKSRIGENGKSEQEVVTRIAQIRQGRMRALADRLKAPGLIPRGDFWVAVVTAGDWNMVGDARGEIEIKQGRRVQVGKP
ncbi:MAG: chitosanase [Chloroflexota bacterium]|nr:chitosanase [Chloroflexota bacterium]